MSLSLPADRVPGLPVLDPVGAVGWTAGVMDGLNCTQRCIEAVLRMRGRGSPDVVRAFAAPLDLLHRRTPDWHWPGCRIVWAESRDPRRNWALLGDHLDQGRWPFVMIDRYHWPGDEHEGSRHVQSYVVMALGWDEGRLVSLGVHGDEEDGYRHRTPVSKALPRACGRVGLLDVGTRIPAGGPDASPAWLVKSSVQPLAGDVAALRAFADAWSGRGWNGHVDWPLGTLVFSDLEPQTFLLGAALEGAGESLAGVRSAAFAAASAALRLGLVLLEANRTGDAEARRLAGILLDRLIGRLEELLTALQHSSDERPAPATCGPAPVLERLATIAELCYSRELEAPLTPDRLRRHLETST